MNVKAATNRYHGHSMGLDWIPILSQLPTNCQARPNQQRESRFVEYFIEESRCHKEKTSAIKGIRTRKTRKSNLGAVVTKGSRVET